MMRLLVTGSRGLLGTAICREFAAEDVVALDHATLDITDDAAAADDRG